MSNERADEFLPWRGRLTPPDALPEQDLEDKELSWQRLAERLGEKPRRRGIAWWISAACLLFALFPATLFFRDRPIHRNRVALHTPARRSPVTQPQPVTQTQPITAPTPAPTPAPTAPAPTPAPAPFRRLASLPASAPTDRLAPRLAPRLAAQHLIAPPPNYNYGEIAPIKPNSPTDTLSTPVLADITPPSPQPPTSAPPRPLRIVYLNELNKDPGRSAVATRQPAFLHLGADAAPDWTTNQQNISIPKIEISPSANH